MRARYLIVAGIVAMVGAGACGGEDTTTTPATDGTTQTETPAATETDAGGAGSLSMSGFAFVPSDVTAGEGGLLAITNEDSAAHTFTMDDGSVDEEVGAGQSVEVTVTAAGSFHCEIHPAMTGTVSLG